MRRTLGAALALSALITAATRAQNPPDTVVLRIEGATGGAVEVSGTVRLREGAEERRYTKVRTPFELRIPAQALEARFSGPLGHRLSGRMTLLRDGRQVGWVDGETRFGSLRFYRTATGAYGFGQSLASASSPVSYQQRPTGLLSLLDRRATPCVRTAPMPSARLSSGDAMPAHSADSAAVAHMPVDRRVPCYQADTIR